MVVALVPVYWLLIGALAARDVVVALHRRGSLTRLVFVGTCRVVPTFRSAARTVDAPATAARPPAEPHAELDRTAVPLPDVGGRGRTAACAPYATPDARAAEAGPSATAASLPPVNALQNTTGPVLATPSRPTNLRGASRDGLDRA